jgi:hypothetical protein
VPALSPWRLSSFTGLENDMFSGVAIFIAEFFIVFTGFSCLT